MIVISYSAAARRTWSPRIPGVGSDRHGLAPWDGGVREWPFRSTRKRGPGWLASLLACTRLATTRPGQALAWALVAGLLGSGNAEALPIVGGGIDTAQGCTTVACRPSETLVMNPTTPLASAEGTIEFDPVALTLSVQMNVASLSLTGVGGVPDNGVSEVLFLNTIYSAIAVPLIDIGGGYVIDSGQTANLSGILSQDGTASGFVAIGVLLDGGCTPTGEGVRCGISFGPMNLTAGVGSESPQPRYFVHVAQITTVPEPSTLVLMGMALLAGLATSRRA